MDLTNMTGQVAGRMKVEARPTRHSLQMTHTAPTVLPEHHEPIPNLATRWRRAPERMDALLVAHPEMTKLAVACVINNGDPI